MTCYLTIMVTVLVVTQIIRLIQNTIQLRHMKDKFGRHTDEEVLAMWKELVNSVDKLSDVVFILIEENRRQPC